MTTKRLSGLLVVAVMLLASCGKKNPSYTKYIAKDANYVVGIDVRSILEKLNKDSLSVEKIMTTFKDETSTEKFTKALDTYNQFKDAGIDWTSRVYVAVTINSGGIMGSGAFSGNVEAVAGLKDAKKFEEFLKKQPNTKDIKKGDGFSYTGDGEKMIGWNDDAVLFVTAQTGNTSYDVSGDDSTIGSRPQSADNATASTDLLKKFFKQDKKESIAEAEGFSDLQSQKGDVVVYSQSGNMVKGFLVTVPKLADFVKGYSTSVVNFENGKVVTESTSHLTKEAADFLKKYAGPEVNWSLVENYASSNIDGVVAFSFDPKLIPGLVQYLGFEGPAGMVLPQAGLTLEETGKIFKGDFAVVVSDFTMNGQPMQPGKDDAMSSTSSGLPTAKMVFVAPIGDKAVFEKLLKLGIDKGFIVRNGNNIMPNPQMTGGTPFPYAVSVANDQLVFASDAATLAAYQAKTGKITLPSGVESTLKGKAASAFVDAQKIMAGISPNVFNSSNASEKAIFDQAKATFKDGWYTFSNLSSSTISSKAEFNLMSDKQNSLSQIIKFGMFAYEQTKAERAARKAEWENMPSDSVKFTPPVIVQDSVK